MLLLRRALKTTKNFEVFVAFAIFVIFVPC